MPLPSTTPIELNEILEEFGAPPRTPLSAMVRGGDYVPVDSIGGPNQNIPTSTPIQISDFVDADGNPNPYQITDELLTPVQDSGGLYTIPAVRLLSNKRNEGLLVGAHDGSASVPAAAQFVIDVKLKVGPSALAEPSIGNITGDQHLYSSTQRVMGFWIGITTANPATASDTTLYNSMVGWRVDFYETEHETGLGVVKLGSVNATGNAVSGNGYIETADSTYEDDILPSLTTSLNMRFWRGDPVNGAGTGFYSPDWVCEVFDDDTWTNQTHQKIASAGFSFFNPSLANLGGYLCMAVVNNGSPNGNLQIDIEDVRAYSGGQTEPW